MARTRNHRLAARLGGAGAVAGFAAGLVQLTVGSSIPEWTGAKSSSGALGLLTMGLSLLAGFAALRQRDVDLTTGLRTAYAAMIFATALLCFTTVGWLWWWLPAPLLFAGGSLTIDNARNSVRAIRDNWARCLLTVLGGSEMLMAAGAGPLRIEAAANWLVCERICVPVMLPRCRPLARPWWARSTLRLGPRAGGCRWKRRWRLRWRPGRLPEDDFCTAAGVVAWRGDERGAGR